MSTICAIATPPGGALGLVRLSGDMSFEIVDKIFHSANDKPISKVRPNTIHYGCIYDSEGNIIDDVLVSKFKAPHSFTGEDSIEISCHGSHYILSKVVEELICHGCRQADPGEFTKRAFLNGKMDLSQAEAVADIISAENKASHDVALSQMRGGFSSVLNVLREKLLKMTSLLELELDFSEEDVEFADRQQLLLLAEEIKSQVTNLLSSFQIGKVIKEGVPVVIVGKTNVGKSTLLNRILHEDKAIVSDIHGTTRDALEDITIIHGVMFRFIDTAGLRITDDKIENIGIQRTYEKLAKAHVVLWVVDEEPSLSEIDDMMSRCLGKSLLLIRNKSDKGIIENSISLPCISISARYDESIEPLEDFIFSHSGISATSQSDVIVTNARHVDALMRASSSLDHVIYSITSQLSGDLIAEDLRECLHILAEITGGEITSAETLSNIFSHFCIGK